jgi:hypothetical protein
MAERAREEAQRKRSDARGRRRSLAAKPFEALDDAAGGSDGDGNGTGNGADPFAAAKQAARTAAAAALAGGVAGAAKALLQRRGEAQDDDSPDDDEREGDQRPQPAADVSEEDERPTDVDEDAREGDEETGSEPEAEHEEPPEPTPERRQPQTRHDAAPQKGASSSDVASVVDRARSQVTDVLGKDAESVSGISRMNGSWSVLVEVVEVHRVPDSTDVLASYEVVLDDDGNLVSLERRNRYRRSQVEEER